MRTAIAILVLCCLANAVLPPGYEEEMYCKAEACLKPRPQLDGYTGPRTAFFECCDESTGTRSPPRAWGEKVGQEVKQQLIADNWHRRECDASHAVCIEKTERRSAAALRSMLRRIDSLLVSLYS
jgi:hypothetical protein